ncbi:DNA topoisomerase I [Acidiplasma sp.]|uniref:DNA topoisomerase I n=1 Tax=Acidiplasma sp. TaxID=1872114 RepID=UPI0025853076|nr:DNA topoisomerase I [Acidiplasma sp.]
MSINLIIAEKADAGRRIAYILSEKNMHQKKSKNISYIEFDDNGEKNIMVALSGHIVESDFPESFKDWIKSDLDKLIDSEIVYNIKNKKASDALQSFNDIKRVIIATDYDREGELIGVESLKFLKNYTEVKRAKFSALTNQEIKDAFKNLIDVNYGLADSARAREEIDLLWGAVLTRFFSVTSNRLWKDFISVGRVQTPTLALIVKREEEIQNFIPEKYYQISVKFNKKIDFTARYEKDIKDKSEAESIFNDINNRDGTVKSYDREEREVYKPVPFSTTEFLREASRLGITPSNAMKVAEKLYMSGLISYPRTDNTVYQRSIPLKSIAEKFLKSDYENEAKLVINQERIIPSRGKIETTDHPPIYPVNLPQKPLNGAYKTVYDLIVRRFLATLYKNARIESSRAEIEINGHMFVATGQRILDPGWYEIYKFRKLNEIRLPELKSGESVSGREWNLEEKETEPPKRYDIASLLKMMESLNLGTKSTRHDIIQKLNDRNFATGNPVRPTPLGIGFIKSVTSIDSDIAKPDMTAKLEKEMDEIAENKKNEIDVVNESRLMLHEVLKNFRSNRDSIKETITEYANKGEVIGKCPIDNGDISVIKYRNFEKIKCSNDECKINFNISGTPLIQLTDKKCPVCGLPLIKIIRRGQSPEIRCIDPECSYNKNTYGKCPSDGGDLIIRQSRYGKRFLGCSNYPKCTVTYPLPQKGIINSTGEVCPYCGAPLLLLINGKRRWKFCPNIKCEYNRKDKGEKAKE